jgi:hypothetical protein
MLGLESLEQKLREGNGKTARATVLTAKDGVAMQYSGIHNNNGGFGGTDITRHHYTLRVEPEGEEPFEAKIVIRADKLGGPAMAWRLSPGATAAVLYDPDDHRKVAFDVAAMQAANQGRRHSIVELAAAAAAAAEQRSVPSVESVSDPGSEIDKLKELADLRDRGALTDAEFGAEKLKLLS